LDPVRTHGGCQDKLFVFDVVPPHQYAGSDAYERDWENTLDMLDGTITFEISDLALETGTRDIAYSHSIQQVTGS
jgi:ketosteroid isomerase-like protein